MGFSFCTLERIGGTPCVLWGLVSVKRCPQRTAILDALRADQFRKAVLAFPDEDVLVATRLREPGGLRPSTAGGHLPPSRLQGLGRGAGLVHGAWPSASAPRAGSTTAASSSGAMARPARFSTTSPRTRRGRPGRRHGHDGTRPGPA